MAKSVKSVSVYAPGSTEAVQVTRANAVDLVRFDGFTFVPGIAVAPNEPTKADISTEDNAPDLSENSATGMTSKTARELLEETALNLGVKFKANLGDDKLKERVESRKAELKAEGKPTGEDETEAEDAKE